MFHIYDKMQNETKRIKGKETGSSYRYTWVKGTLATCLSRIKNSLKFAGHLRLIKLSSVSHHDLKNSVVCKATVSVLKLVTSAGLQPYFHLHQLSVNTWIKAHRVRLLTVSPKHFGPRILFLFSFLHH